MTRILVVDDSQTSLQLLDVLLFREGFEPYSCAEPANAVAVALKHKVSAAVFDLIRVEPTGLKLLQQLRRHPQLKLLPVVFVVGDSSPQERAKALAHGANEILTRPFDPQELFFRLRRLLQTVPFSPEAAVVGDMARFFVGDLLQQLVASGAEGVLSFTLPQPAETTGALADQTSSRAALAVALSGASQGEVHLKAGRICRAQLGRWDGEPALAALLRVREGTFRFVEQPVIPAEQVPLDPQQVLMNLAWWEDEVEAKSHLLPGLDDQLFPTDKNLRGENKFADTPSVLELIRAHPGITRRDLWKTACACPIGVDASIIELVERGVVAKPQMQVENLKAQLKKAVPRGSEVSTTSMNLWLNSFLRRLTTKIAGAEVRPEVVQVSVVWPAILWDRFLVDFVATIPRGVLAVPKEKLLQNLGIEGAATIRLSGAKGAALVHIHRLSGLAFLQARAFSRLAAGVLVGWPPSFDDQVLSFLATLPDKEKAILVPAEIGAANAFPHPEGFKVAASPLKNFCELLDLLVAG